MIKVFVVETCQLLEYEVKESDSLERVKEWIERDARVAAEDQRPLLPRGQPPDPSRGATQCWAPPVSKRKEFELYCSMFLLKNCYWAPERPDFFHKNI